MFSLRVFAAVLLGPMLVVGQGFAQSQSGSSAQQGQAPANQPSQQDSSGSGRIIEPIDQTNGPAQPATGQTQQQPAQAPAQNQPQPVQPIDNGANSQTDQGPVPQSPNQPSDTVTVPTGKQGQAPDSETSGVYIFKKQVEEVRLHATVVDERQRLVTTLDKTAFSVFENGQPQQITSFRQEDVAVALGIVIDNSGSMRDKRPAVNQATLNLVKASNPQDEVFVVNFNDDYYLDQDYTDSIPKLKESLERYETRGGTALYDAVLASNEHLMKAPKLEKRVLFVVTDGEDDASLNTLEQTIRKVQVENGPTIYTIGVLDEQGSHKRRAERALRELAEATGGVAFFPASIDEVDKITQQIAHDIRNQYTILYKPTNPQSQGGYRTVKVEARARGFSKLQVRTRSGYYAGQEAATNAPAKPATNQKPSPNQQPIR